MRKRLASPRLGGFGSLNAGADIKEGPRPAKVLKAGRSREREERERAVRRCSILGQLPPGLPIRGNCLADCFTRWRANCLHAAPRCEGNRGKPREGGRARERPARRGFAYGRSPHWFAYEGNVYDIRIMRAWVFLLRRAAGPCMDKRCPIQPTDLSVALSFSLCLSAFAFAVTYY